jgi:hypothetical protein
MGSVGLGAKRTRTFCDMLIILLQIQYQLLNRIILKISYLGF